MNEKFRTIGLDTEDKITEFIDYIDDLEDTEEIKSDVYGLRSMGMVRVNVYLISVCVCLRDLH